MVTGETECLMVETRVEGKTSLLSLLIRLLFKEWLRRMSFLLSLLGALSLAWKLWAPSKVVVLFSWKLLHNRISTRNNLLRRKVIFHKDLGCSICVGCRNSVSFIFVIYLGAREW